jgi:hypothetical protein
VQAELDRTDHILGEANDKIDESSDPKAKLLLKQATEIQERAKDAFDSEHYRVALNLTMKAQDVANRAIGSIVRGGEDQSLVEQALDRTDELIEQAKTDLTETTGHDRAQLRLEEAIGLQDRARDLYSEKNLRQSLLLTMRAREIVKNVIDLTGNSEQLNYNIKRHLDILRGVIQESRENMNNSKNDVAIALFEAGSNQCDHAEDLLEKGSTEEAGRQVVQASVKINRAIRMVSRPSKEDDTDRAIQTAEAQLERLNARASEIKSHEADKLLEEATDKLAKARQLQDQGDSERALVVVRVVLELNQRAARILNAW